MKKTKTKQNLIEELRKQLHLSTRPSSEFPSSRGRKENVMFPRSHKKETNQFF